MTWRIIKRGWNGCTHLSDTRQNINYAYEELDGALFVDSNDEGEICFQLRDGRIAWLVTMDIEDERPLDDNYLREPA